MDIIQASVEKGQSALSEFQSKKFLSTYGIPVTRESIARSPDEAVSMAEAMGYPVALKASSHDLMHKTEMGVIELHLRDEQDVRRAYDRITSDLDLELEGLLVQEMVPGQRELVLGMTRDPQFGPCVMLGLGGILTEIIKDTVFRVAPIDLAEAQDMIQELRCRKMLEPFRGQEAADLDALCLSLVALGRVGMEEARIEEIDINPMIVDPGGAWWLPMRWWF